MFADFYLQKIILLITIVLLLLAVSAFSCYRYAQLLFYNRFLLCPFVLSKNKCSLFMADCVYYFSTNLMQAIASHSNRISKSYIAYICFIHLKFCMFIISFLASIGVNAVFSFTKNLPHCCVKFLVPAHAVITVRNCTILVL